MRINRTRTLLILILISFFIDYKESTILQLFNLSENKLLQILLDEGTWITAIILLYLPFYAESKKKQELPVNNKQHHLLADFSPEAIFVFKDNKLVYANSAAVDLLEASSDKKLIGKTLSNFVHSSSLLDLYRILKEWENEDTFDKIGRSELKLVTQNKKIIDVEMTSIPLNYEGQQARETVIRDITDKKMKEKLVEFIAYHDPLTNLPNRRFFEKQLKESLTNTKNILAVLFIDLDGFKQINDTFGHETGDLLLKEVAKRLKKCVRKNDIVSRLGGDEFTLLLLETEKEFAIQIAERIIQELQTPILIEEKWLNVSPSIGISLHYSNGTNSQTAQQLIKQADTAMYYVKQHGKNNYTFYEELIHNQ